VDGLAQACHSVRAIFRQRAKRRVGLHGRRTTVLYRNNPIMVVRNETVAGYMFWLATMAFVFGIIIGIVG
jgi:hypothetical protein